MKSKKKLLIVLSAIFVVFILGIIIFIASSHQVKTETIKLKYSGSNTYETNKGSKNDSLIMSFNSSKSDSFTDGLFSIDSTSSSLSNGTAFDIEATEDYYEEGYYEEGYYENDNTSVDSNLLNNKMLKKSYNYTVETTDFNDFNFSLRDKISSLGGYIEDESTDSKEVYNSIFTEIYKVRRLNCIIRVPADKVDDLLELVDNSADVIFKKEYVEDVTSDYIDMETHINSLKSEYEVLENLLTMATSVTEIIEVQDRLTSINQQIESYERNLDSLKTDIAYSKVNLTVEEVIYYQDKVERWTSDLAESWAEIFEEWIEYMILPIALLSISLIPILGVVIGSIYLLMRAVIKYKKKNQSTIILKQDNSKDE